MNWEIILDSRECPYFDQNEVKGYRCENENNETNWRERGGVCEEKFCPIKGDE